MPRPAAALLLLLLPLARLPAQGPPTEPPQLLVLQLWSELDPPRGGWAAVPVPGEEGAQAAEAAGQATRRLLEEARQVLSLMVYGCRFRYVPADNARGVREEFVLEALGEVGWGEPALRVLDTELREERLHARLEYRLSEAQARRRAAWSSNTVPSAAGTGEGDLFQGPAGKHAALEAALREAVRGHLRPRLFSRPREVRGELLLWSEPRTVVQAGRYRSTAAARLRVTQVIPYRIF